MNILQINSSARREGSHSTRLADRIVDRLRAAHPAATVTVRDLTETPHPVLDEAALDGREVRDHPLDDRHLRLAIGAWSEPR